jgi:hypothetical protein
MWCAFIIPATGRYRQEGNGLRSASEKVQDTFQQIAKATKVFRHDSKGKTPA